MTPNTHLQEDNLENTLSVSAHEFDKHFFEHLDRRYYTILLISIFVHLSAVFYFVANPPSGELSESDIEKMQKRFADLVLDRPEETEELTFTDFTVPNEQTEISDVTSKEGQADSEGAATLPGAKTGNTNTTAPAVADADGIEAGEPAAAAPRRTGETIRNEARTLGVLGLLSSTSGKASGQDVSDVLGQGEPGGQIKEKLANISGTQLPGAEKARSGSEGTIRGSRETEGGGTDELKVSSLGKSGTSNKVARSGNLRVQEVKPLIDTDDGEILQGAREPDEVAAVVHSHNSAIQYCYQRELKRDPDLRGKLVVRFKITPQGTVNSTTILSSTLNNTSVEKCIVSRINRWNDFGAIDPLKGDTTIRQVYTFGY